MKYRGLSVGVCCVCVWVVNMRSKKFDKLVLCDLDILSFSCCGVFLSPHVIVYTVHTREL